MSIRERAADAVRGLWQLPCKLMLATIVLCVGVREWYPFSPFPMYATFGPTAWYVCVTDADDRPLPTARYLGLDAIALRRMFETRLRTRLTAGTAQRSAEAAAALDTLEFLVRETRAEPGTQPSPERIGLQRTQLRIDAERIGRTRETLAVLGDR